MISPKTRFFILIKKNLQSFLIIHIKVTPHASIDKIDGMGGGYLRVHIRGVPEKGKVNERLIEFLADQLGIRKSAISIESGETSRLKRIRIDGLTKEELPKNWVFTQRS